MRFSIFHLGIEDNGVHVGGLFEMEASAPRGGVLLEAVADGKSVSSAPGGFREFREPDAPQTTTSRFWDFTIPADSSKPFHVSFLVRFPDGHSEPCRIDYRNNASLSEKTRTSYFRMRGRLFFSEPPYGFLVRPASFFRHVLAELRYDAWLLFKQPRRRSKAAIPIRWMVLWLRPWMLKRRYWLVMDRITIADDNGLAMFRYLMAHRHDIGCRPVFVLDKKSREWKEVRKIGPVIPYSGFRYRFATLFAEWTIASPSQQQVVHPLRTIPDGYRGLANTHQLAFLGHGVTLHDVSQILNRSYLDCSAFVTASRTERDSVINNPAYGQNAQTVVLSGLPRFDFLENHREKKVIFMPTWRESLISGWNTRTGKSMPRETFKDSDYFRHLHVVLSSRRLLDEASRLGYAVEFFPHPEVQPLAPLFTDDPRVRILPPGTKYRGVFARGALCVTDYSSAVFDFAWLGKPVVYYQPDDDNHYAKGYFKYELDGFGPVFHAAEELIDYLIDMMHRDCPMEEPYRTRAKTFFAFHDKNNCRRVTEAILAASSISPKNENH